VRPDGLPAWLARQQQAHPNSIELGLERVSAVARRLSVLPWTTPAIIVGGTNGKGSTASYVAAFAQAAGARTGLFTSPHLRRYQERIVVDGMPVDDLSLLAAFADIEAARGDISLTFFECNALAALWVFRRARVDLAVLEVGLGGRLDATNMIDADVAVLCTVAIDHAEWLGPDRESIGREKAGIFRPGRPVVLGPEAMPASVHGEIDRLGAIAHVAGRDFQWPVQANGCWDFRGSARQLTELPAPALRGPRQRQNAATALAALEALAASQSPPRPATVWPDQMQAAEVLRRLTVPGRLQLVTGRPAWVLDVAHNAQAAGVLAEFLRGMPCAGRRIAVFGMLADKDVGAVAAELTNDIDLWVPCSIGDTPRGLTQQAVCERLPRGAAIAGMADSVPAGCALAHSKASPEDQIVVCGSFHTVGPALDWLGL
jgi:dihydrofolate synthase/folylpolyglutamate synthase